MGRWSYATFRRKQLPPLTIFTVYQVNPRPTNEIGITAWHQQRLQLNEQNRNECHPRTAFIDDLIMLIKSKLTISHEIIIGGDFNDSLDNPRSQLRRFMSATGLVDTWTNIHPHHTPFSSYNRGSKRIDIVLCTPLLLQNIHGQGYSPYNWFTNSDHRAIVIDFDETSLFGSKHNPIPAQNLRGIRTNDRQQVATFIHQWHKHLKAQGIFQRIKKLNPTTTPIELESIDRVLGEGGESAERKCRKRRTPMYSTQLAKLRLLATITKCNFACYNKGNVTLPRSKSVYAAMVSTTTSRHTWISRNRRWTKSHKNLHPYSSSIGKSDNRSRKNRISKACHNKRKDKEKLVRNIKKSEARRRTWQILKFRSGSRGGTQTRLDRIDVPASWPTTTRSNVRCVTTGGPKNMHQLDDDIKTRRDRALYPTQEPFPLRTGKRNPRLQRHHLRQRSIGRLHHTFVNQS